MKNKITNLSILGLTSLTVASGFMLAASGAKAVTNNATVTVPDACGFTTTGYTWNLTANGGQVYNTESETKSASVTCNNPNGFKIKAAGSPDTDLSGASTGLDIATGTSGSNSYWAFKVTSATSSASSPTIASGTGYDYSAYSAVPSAATEIISYPGSATAVVTGTFRTDYKISVSSTQAADTYTGGVQYTIVPN